MWKNIIVDKKTSNIIVAVFAFLGVVCISSGAVMPSLAKKGENIVKVKVTQKQVAAMKTNEIKPKDIEIEINQPLSVDVKDYLDEIDKIETSVLKKLKLDTSEVNTNQAGSYTYIITYKKKNYTGTITIKEKELPTIDISLRDLSLVKGSALPTDLASYIIGTIPEEAITSITIDLTGVNINSPSTYQYSVTYNGKMYTASITIYEPQPNVVITPIPSEEKPNTNIETPKPELPTE